MTNLPIDVYEGVVHTSPFSKLVRVGLKNLWHMARNRTVLATTTVIVATWAAVTLLGLWVVLPLYLGCAAILGLLRARHPVWFRRNITLKAWSCIIGVWKYRRRWRKVLRKSGVIDSFEDPPRILKVTATRHIHTIKIKMNDGHTINGNYNYNLEELTQSFNAIKGDITPIHTKPRQLDIRFIAKDPLINPVPPYPTTTQQLFTGYPLAMCDTLEPWILKLPGTHVAVGGETGSGKGSVFWNIIMALQKARRDGYAKLFGMDHKGGVELGLGGKFHGHHFLSPFFDQFSYQSSGESVRLLDFALKEKDRRQRIMLGKSRLWIPDGKPGNEHITIACDEIGALTAWTGDRKLRTIAANKIALVINQARAFGISFVYAGQDLRKDIAAFRGQTPDRLQGRTPEPWDIDNMLGPGAWRHGARADEIPDSMPGTFYCARDGKKGFDRIRFGDWTNDMIMGNEPTYAADVAEAKKMAEKVAENYQGIRKVGGFA